MNLDFSRCRDVWVPDDSEAGGFWSPPPAHVRHGVERIIGSPYFMLADDMGGMKTAQSIIAAQFLHDMDEVDRAIIVAPASVRSKVWFDQDLGQLVEQVWDDKRHIVSQYHATIKQWMRGPVGVKEMRWIVTNYEFIRDEANLRVLLPYCGPRTMLILDESSAVKAWNSGQTDACMRLRWRTNAKGRPIQGVVRCGRVLELTGTPVADSPLDIFSQANLLHPSILGCRYVTHFKARYAVEEAVLTWDGEPLTKAIRGGRKITITRTTGWRNIDDLQRRMAPYVLRREAKDFGVNFALPPVGLEVPLTPATWRIYKDVRDEMVAWLKTGVATARTAAVKSLRLSQVTSGFLGGVEDELPDDLERVGLLEELGAPPSYLTDRPVPVVSGPGRTEEIGREKLDFALGWQEELLKRDPNVKLLTWCRFVPELRRYLAEVIARFPQASVGAACGQKVIDTVPGSQKAEREYALRLLHPKTAPPGAAIVGATQGTGALGLNFTACRTVLDMSYDFSPWKKKQGDARVDRPGQTGPVSFFYLIAVGPKGQKTMDHHVMLTRLGKTRINDLTMAAWVKMLTEE